MAIIIKLPSLRALWALGEITRANHLEQCLVWSNHLIDTAASLEKDMCVFPMIKLWAYDQRIFFGNCSGQSINDEGKGRSLLRRGWFVAKQPYADGNGPSSCLPSGVPGDSSGSGLQPYLRTDIQQHIQQHQSTSAFLPYLFLVWFLDINTKHSLLTFFIW